MPMSSPHRTTMLGLVAVARCANAGPDSMSARTNGTRAIRFTEQAPFISEWRCLLAAQTFLQLLHRLIDAERGRALAGREFLEGLEERGDDRHAGECDPLLGHDPVPVGIGSDVRALVRVRVQIEELG